MITNVLFSWNEFTVPLVLWFVVVGVALLVDFGPEIYREKKAREQLFKSVLMLAERKASAPTLNPTETLQLGSFKIHPTQAKRRHAKV